MGTVSGMVASPDLARRRWIPRCTLRAGHASQRSSMWAAHTTTRLIIRILASGPRSAIRRCGRHWKA